MAEKKKKERRSRGSILFFVIVGLLVVALIPYEAIFGFVVNLVFPDFSLTTWKPVIRLSLWLLISVPMIYLGKNSDKKAILLYSLIVIAFLVAIMLMPSNWLLIAWSYAFRITLLLAVFLLISIQILAPNNIFFTKVKEATSKIIVKGGQFNKCLIQRQGYTFDYEKKHPEKWTVIEENEEEGKVEPWHPLGGIRFYGVWPLWDVKKYDLQWTTVKEEDEISKSQRLAYVPVYDDIYLAKIISAEDANQLHLDVHIYLRVVVVNPYKVVFAPQAWLEMLINTTRPVIRRFVAQITYSDLLKEQQTMAGRAWGELEEEGFLGEDGLFIQRYGMKVLSIQFRQIEPPAEFRKQTIAEILAELEAAAEIAKARGDKAATILRAEAFREKISLISAGFRNLPEEIRDSVVYTLIAEFTSGKDTPGMMLLHGLSGKLARGESSDLSELEEVLRNIAEKINQGT